MVDRVNLAGQLQRGWHVATQPKSQPAMCSWNGCTRCRFNKDLRLRGGLTHGQRGGAGSRSARVWAIFGRGSPPPGRWRVAGGRPGAVLGGPQQSQHQCPRHPTPDHIDPPFGHFSGCLTGSASGTVAGSRASGRCQVRVNVLTWQVNTINLAGRTTYLSGKFIYLPG